MTMKIKKVHILIGVIAFCLLLYTFYLCRHRVEFVHEENPIWLDYLKKLHKQGVCEKEGALIHPFIDESFALVGLDGRDDDKTSWCSAGLNMVFYNLRDRIHIVGTLSGLAKSWLEWGGEVKKYKPGNICIFRVREGYHVTVLLDAVQWRDRDGNFRLTCIGCNQGGCIKPSGYKLVDLVAMRWPTINEMGDE